MADEGEEEERAEEIHICLTPTLQQWLLIRIHQIVVMPCGWEGNPRPVVALAMRHRLQCGLRAVGLTA